MRLPNGKQDGILRNVDFGIWLGRSMSLLAGAASGEGSDARTYADELDAHLALSPWLFLPQFAPDPSEAYDSKSLRIGPGGISGPIGVDWRLRTTATGSVDAQLVFDDRGVKLRCDGRTIADVPRTSWCAGSRGGEVTVDARELIVEPKVKAGGGSIEIGRLADFPEIARSLDSPDPEDGPTGRISADDDDPARIVAAVGRCLDALGRVWPEAEVDVRRFCRLLIPLQTTTEVRYNSTHPGLPYVQAVTLNRGGDVERSESMLHEAMHTKLFMLSHLSPLVSNDGPLLYRHPWRPDPRPIMGVFLGVHAFLAVLVLYRKAVELEPTGARREAFAARRDRLSTEVGEALDELERGAKFTDLGRAVAQGMRAAYQE